MDLFVHVLAAGLVAEGVARVRRRDEGRPATALRLGGAVVLGAASHLGLDALPHFGFLPSISVWISLPDGWLLRALAGGLLAFAFVVWKAGKSWPVVVAACFGAVYPDVEKVAHNELAVPFVLFRAHAELVNTYTAGVHLKVLAALEIALAALFAALYARLAARRRAESTTPPP